VKGADLLIGETIGMKRVIADRGYDANRIRAALREQGTIPVIPERRNRKRSLQYDERRYKDRWRVEVMFCRLKDLRRIAHPLRQARQKLPLSRKLRCRRGILALNESGP